MAVIGKIRNRMGVLLVVFVGVALLAFVLGDLLSSSQYFLQGDRITVGKLNGHSVKYDEFDRRVKQKEKFFADMNPQASLDDETRNGLLDETWQEFVDKYVLNEQFEQAGVRVGDLELKDMMGGRFIHPFIQQQFTNPETGAFDASGLQNFLTYISEEPADQDEATRADWEKRRAQWANIETAIEKNRLQTKYQTLLEKGMYVTDKEVARQYAESGDRFNIRYVGKAYSEVADSTVEISDSDLKKAYDENKNRFKTDYAVRGLRYALFDIVPTAKDSLALYTKLNGIKADFEASKDDTSFVYSNSDLQKDPRYLRRELLPKVIDSAVYNAPNGFVYGPYVDAGSYYLAKKVGEKTSPDSLKMAIVIVARKNQQGQDRPEAKAKADSILAAAKSGINFQALAAASSEDPNAKRDSGVVDWIPYEIEGNPIVDTAYKAAIGAINLVENPDAYYIVKTVQKSAPVRKILIAFVSTDIKPSEETVNAIYAAASDFALSNKTIEDFDKAAKSGKYVIRDDAYLRENAKTVTGIPESKNMVKWAFEKKVGDVSAIEQFGNRYMIAIVTKSWSAGIPSFEEVKKDLETFAKRDKKAAMFMEELKTAAASGNIDQVGTAVKKPVIPATDITFQSYGVPGAGYEPGIIGAAAGAAKGKLTGPFKGVNGVYVVIVDEATKGANPPASPQQKSEMSRMSGQRVFSEAFNALNSAADVRDMRFKFY